MSLKLLALSSYSNNGTDDIISDWIGDGPLELRTPIGGGVMTSLFIGKDGLVGDIPFLAGTRPCGFTGDTTSLFTVNDCGEGDRFGNMGDWFTDGCGIATTPG